MRLLQDEKAEETTHTYTKQLPAQPGGLYVHGVRQDGDVPDDAWLPFAPDRCTIHVTEIKREGPTSHWKLTVSLEGRQLLCRRTWALGEARIVRHEAYGWSDTYGADVLGEWWPTPLGEAPPAIHDFAVDSYAHTRYPHVFDKDGRRKVKLGFPAVGLDIPL